MRYGLLNFDNFVSATKGVDVLIALTPSEALTVCK